MHKGIICLTQADNENEAVSKVEDFLEQYGNGHVWDWFVVGGRWSGTLNSKTKEFFAKATEHFKTVYPNVNHDFLTVNIVSEQAEALQKIWEDMGESSRNPYGRDQYKDRTGNDDVVPLSDCIDIVKTWTIDVNVEAEEAFQKMLEARKDEKKKGSGIMSAYYAGKYRDFKYDSFSFDSNVYDIENETNDPQTAIDDPEGWYAVMVDLHN